MSTDRGGPIPGNGEVIGEGLVQAARYALPVLVLLGVCAFAGLVFVVPLGARSDERLVSALVGGVTLLITASTWWAYTEKPVTAVAVGMMICALAGAGLAAWWGYRRHRSGLALRRLGRPVALALLGILVAVALALVQYWPVLSSGFLPDRTTAFTNANNDIGIYILESDNVMHAGYGDAGRVLDYPMGSSVKGDHPGTSAALAAASKILDQPTWQFAIPFMAATIAITILCLAAIARRAGRVGRAAAIVAAFWAISAPFPSSVQSDYFIAQSLSRLLLFAQVLFVLQALSWGAAPARRPLPFVLIALTTSAGLLAYPAAQLTSMAVVAVIAVCVVTIQWFERRDVELRKQSVVRLAALAVSMLAGVLLVAPRWQNIIDVVRLYSKAAITGFPLPTWQFATLAGIGRSPDWWSSIGPWLAIVVFTLAVVGVVRCAARMRSSTWLLAALVLVPLGGYGLLVARLGSSAYQTWKFVATVQPLALASIAVFAIHGATAVVESIRRPTDHSRVVLALAIAPVAAIACFALGTSQGTWRESTASRGGFAQRQVTPTLSRIGDDPLVRAQPNLVIALAPYFESMVAAPVGDLTGTVFGVPTYFGAGDRGTGCALVHAHDLPADAPPYHRIDDDLMLGPTSACVAPAG